MSITLPKMRRVPFLLRTCKMPGCNRQADYVSVSDASGFCLCSFHMNLIIQGHLDAAQEQRRREKDLDL
jgi:hypothetical protein